MTGKRAQKEEWRVLAFVATLFNPLGRAGRFDLSRYIASNGQLVILPICIILRVCFLLKLVKEIQGLAELCIWKYFSIEISHCSFCSTLVKSISVAV